MTESQGPTAPSTRSFRRILGLVVLAEIAVVYLPSDTGVVQLESARSTWLAEDIDAAQMVERFPGALAKQSQIIQPGSEKAPFIENFAKTNARGLNF